MPDLPGKSKSNPGLFKRLFGSSGSCCCGVRIVPEPEDTREDQKDSSAERAGQAENESKKTS